MVSMNGGMICKERAPLAPSLPRARRYLRPDIALQDKQDHRLEIRRALASHRRRVAPPVWAPRAPAAESAARGEQGRRGQGPPRDRIIGEGGLQDSSSPPPARRTHIMQEESALHAFRMAAAHYSSILHLNPDDSKAQSGLREARRVIEEMGHNAEKGNGEAEEEEEEEDGEEDGGGGEAERNEAESCSCSGDEDNDAFMRGLMGMRKGTNGRWRQRRPDRILEGRVWELAFGVVGVRGANRRAQRCGAERRSYGI
eukprot:jgi/Bigna1/79567/fgenesh1_pg.63_\